MPGSATRENQAAIREIDVRKSPEDAMMRHTQFTGQRFLLDRRGCL